MNGEIPNSPPATDWGALILGALLLLSAILTILSAPILALLGLATPAQIGGMDSLSLFMLAAGVFLLGTLLIPGAYLNARKFFNQPEPGLRLPAIPPAAAVVFLGALWGITLAIGAGVADHPALSGLLLPILNVFAVLLPIGIVLIISLKGLPLPGARRGWSIFGASLITVPFLATFLEMFAFLGFLLLFALYASVTPGLDVTLMTLAENLKNGSGSSDFLTRQAASLLFAPGAALALLGLFSLAVPIIEEGLKTTLLWFYAGRIDNPVEGFVLGALCGAAFSLAENIGFASTGSSGWLANVASRATAALPHIFNSGLMGWALVSAWQKKNYPRLGLTYLAVILVHGAWNALSIALALTSLSSFVANVPAIIETPIPATITWAVLTIGLAGGLFIANAQMRKLSAMQSAENLRYNSGSSQPNSGEHHGSVENLH